MQIDYVILGLLAARPFSGYDIHKWLSGPGRFVGYTAQRPHIYRTLSKLDERGWVRYEVDPGQGKPDAKRYRLTEAGHRALLDWANSPYVPAPRLMDPEFNVRFIFAGQLDRAIAISLLRTELQYRQQQLQNPTRLEDWAVDLDPAPGLDMRWAGNVYRLAHENGRSSMLSFVDWLQQTLQSLTKQTE